MLDRWVNIFPYEVIYYWIETGRKLCILGIGRDGERIHIAADEPVTHRLVTELHDAERIFIHVDGKTHYVNIEAVVSIYNYGIRNKTDVESAARVVLNELWGRTDNKPDCIDGQRRAGFSVGCGERTMYGYNKGTVDTGMYGKRRNFIQRRLPVYKPPRTDMR